MRIRIFPCSFHAEVGGDVGEGAVGLAAEHALVGAGGGEGAEVGDVRADFDVVELLAVEGVGDVLAAAVPGGLEPWVSGMQVGGKGGHFVGGSIAPHKAYAGDMVVHCTDKGVKDVGSERGARVGP